MNPPKMKKLQTTFRWLTAAGAALLGMTLGATPAHAQSPGLEALDDFMKGPAPRPAAVTNRFFKKANRLEIAPMFGYVPNNPFVRRYVGALGVGYHFSEAWSVHVQAQYAPDLGEADLKDLPAILLDRANTADTENFEQPFEKVTLAASVDVAWAPVYGKINLVGETVLNFDFYLRGGLGFVLKNNYRAVYQPNPDDPSDIIGGVDPSLDAESDGVPGGFLGIGGNFFLNQTIAIKLDVRSAFYVDQAPQYTLNADGEGNGDLRLYTNLVAGAGVSLFFPRMKPRLYNF